MNNTVLIIEDNADIRENVSELLQLAGYKTLLAENGKAGLEMALQCKPDLILCDIMMPELDGYGVLRALENNHDLSGVPFVYLSAKTKRADLRMGMDLGADDYLFKPFTGDELLRIVSARIRKNMNLKAKYENNLNGLDNLISSAKHLFDINTISENRTIKRLRQKDMLYMEGDSANFLYFVVSGKVKTYKTNELDKEYIMEINREGDFFGYVPLFEGGQHKESAVAIENSEIALIPKQDFFNLLLANSRISIEFIRLISRNYAEAEEKLIKLAYNSARKRVAEALLFISEKYKSDAGGQVSFALQRENISAIAGISPESVSRNLTEFKEEGLIRTDNGAIVIVDFKKLESMKN